VRDPEASPAPRFRSTRSIADGLTKVSDCAESALRRADRVRPRLGRPRAPAARRRHGRHEPRQLDAIVEAELDRALADPDPLRGIAQLTARWAAAFVLDAGGVTRTKALGTEHMARKLRDALPGGEGGLRAAVWEFMRPMLSPSLVALNLDAFITNDRVETTVDLDGHRAPSDLDELVLGEEHEADAA
jgi:hypothetical protein